MHRKIDIHKTTQRNKNTSIHTRLTSLAWNEATALAGDLDDLPEWATYARYCITFLVFSVFPAPDSPLSGLCVCLSISLTMYLTVCMPIYFPSHFRIDINSNNFDLSVYLSTFNFFYL